MFILLEPEGQDGDRLHLSPVLALSEINRAEWTHGGRREVGGRATRLERHLQLGRLWCGVVWCGHVVSRYNIVIYIYVQYAYVSVGTTEGPDMTEEDH